MFKPILNFLKKLSGLETLNNTIKLINIVAKKLYVEKYFAFKKNIHFNKKLNSTSTTTLKAQEVLYEYMC